jgi:hypothetical protein
LRNSPDDGRCVECRLTTGLSGALAKGGDAGDCVRLERDVRRAELEHHDSPGTMFLKIVGIGTDAVNPGFLMPLEEVTAAQCPPP